MFTGISSRHAAAVLAAVAFLLAGGSSHAQSLKLASLYLPGDVRAGSWVSYQVTVESKSRPPRRFTQRLSVVSREGSGEESGAWVELKTTEAGRTRFERGFFTALGRMEEGMGTDLDPERDSTAQPTRLKLVRYQVLTPDGKLYEYPLGEEGAPVLDGDISAMNALEFTGGASSDSLPPDTLRVGNKVVPCRVTRTRRYGTHDWQGDDKTYMNRALMTRTLWRNVGIPVTRYARLRVEVTTDRVPVRSGAPPDTSLTSATAPPKSEELAGGFIYRGELALLDLGHNAVPEVTQAPEPAPEGSTPRSRKIIR